MLTGFVGAFIIGLIRIGAFGAKQGWDQLWIVSLFNKAQMATGTKHSEPRKPSEKRRKTPSAAPAGPQPSSRRTAATPRPRPVGARPSTDIPRIAHPSQEAPAPFGRYPGQQPSRATSDARSRQQPPTARRLTPEQMEDLRRRRRELALRVQRARAQQGGRMPPPQQGRRMPPPGGRIPPRQTPPSGGRRPYIDPRQAAARGRMGPDPRRQGMQGQRSMPPHARRPQRPTAEGERRQNPYAQTPPKYNRGRQDPRQPQNPYQRNPYLQGKEPRYRRRREDD